MANLTASPAPLWTGKALAVVLMLVNPVLPAAEVAWPRDSASDLSIFLSTLRFRIYADHCSARLPELEPKFELLLKALNGRVDAISRDLVSSGTFKDMKNTPVPDEIIDAFRDSFDDVRHNLERADAAVVCPMTLQNFGDMDEESLKSGLTQTLTAVQTMIQNLRKATPAR